jgi:hypothetical protein
MQKRPKRQDHLSWDPSANLADFVNSATTGSPSARPHHNHGQNVPGFTNILPTVSTGPRSTALLELPRMQTQGALHRARLALKIGGRMAGSVSSVWNSTRGADVSAVSSRANSAYNRCVPFVDVKQLPEAGLKARDASPCFATARTGMFDVAAVNLWTG